MGLTQIKLKQTRQGMRNDKTRSDCDSVAFGSKINNTQGRKATTVNKYEKNDHQVGDVKNKI